MKKLILKSIATVVIIVIGNILCKAYPANDHNITFLYALLAGFVAGI